MKKKKMPNPDKPLTAKEFSRMKKWHGIDGLPKNAQKAVKKLMGRPRSVNPKKPISFRFDADIVDHLKHEVVGYNSRVESVLREAMLEGRI
jgi:uncharacterized protein (DUF4415 family)